MNPQEAYYFEEKEAREKAQAEKMKGKKFKIEVARNVIKKEEEK